MKKAEILIDYQPYIDCAPISNTDMYSRACSSDGPTIKMWSETWLKNIRENKQRFGSFEDKCLGFLHGEHAGKACIVAGAGPSLKLNSYLLKSRPSWMPLIACLHSFHHLEDVGAAPDYYVSLDAGDITIGEVTEGGEKSEDEYWAKTADRTLIAYIGTSPRLLEKWRGRILFYNSPVPDDEFRKAMDEIEVFHQWVSTGGNVLGACMYIAKAYLGCQVTAFIGADFSFSNREKLRFHAWDSKYDQNIGQTLRAVDIYGCPVLTWPSYHHFALWFNFVAQTLPGFWINCTEGGIFGAFREGNIRAVQQMDLAKFLEIFNLTKHTEHQAKHPGEYVAGKSDIVLV